MANLILNTTSVKEAMAEIAATKLDYYKNTLKLDADEDKIYKEVESDARQSLGKIMADFRSYALKTICTLTVSVFQRIYSKIVVNEQMLKKLREVVSLRRGPVVYCPTHRSYVDFMIVSTILIYYGIEAPFICAGEDLMHITGVSAFLRMCGAFFMRRTFKGDPLYKAIFTEYVTQIVKDRQCIEFFIEGTRSRINRMLTPKFGILKIITDTFFNREVEEVTFVPVNINYTRTLEDSSFPGELTGLPKVGENLGRILSAVDTLNQNYGSIYLDFHEPIKLSTLTQTAMAANKKLDPYQRKGDRQWLNNTLGNQLVFTLQRKQRIMPSNLVATILLMYRRGISISQVAKKVTWLGMTLMHRGCQISDSGLPSETTVKLGLEQLEPFLTRKRDILMPKVVSSADQNLDNSSYIMLNYYRNPINHALFNESLIVCSMMSFGQDFAWKNGVVLEELFERTCYLSYLLKREEVLKKRITRETRAVFDEELEFMAKLKLLAVVEGKDGVKRVVPKSNGEAHYLLIGSICWPLIDTYYVVALFALSLVKRKDVSEAKFSQEVQWVAETMYESGKI